MREQWKTILEQCHGNHWLLKGLLCLLTAFSAGSIVWSQELDKATQAIYLQNLNDPEFIELYAITDVYLKEAGSDTPIRLTNTPASEEFPSLSADRTRLVFCQGGLYLLHLESRDYRELAGEELSCSESLWIPGTDRISFTGDATRQRRFGENRDVYVINPDGGNLQNVTNTPNISEFGHDWSPGGKNLAAIEGNSGRNGKYRVWIQPVQPASERFVAAEFSSAVSKVAWSADGTRIYCSVRESEFVRSLACVDTASGEVVNTPISNLDHDQWDVSPSGSKFLNNQRDKYPVVGVDSQFSEHVEVAGRYPSWCDDGAGFIFVKKALPENFVEDIEKARRPKNFNMILVHDNGDLEYHTDLFDAHSPIVRELPEGFKKQFSGQFKNLTKSEASALLDKNKALQETIRVEYFQWEEE